MVPYYIHTNRYKSESNRNIFICILIFDTYLLHGAELEKLNGSAASQEIPRISWNPKVITVLTSARHLSLS